MASLAYLPLAFALQSPLWVFFRRMDYGRQRLAAGDPAARRVRGHRPAGGGHRPRGVEPGHRPGGRLRGRRRRRAGGVARTGWRLRYDRQVAARYLRFSAPILVTVVSAMVIAQGQILAIKLHDGLAAAGFITLAVTLTRYIDRADQIVTATIYPAICAIQGQRRALEELYVKSNRATLMWVLPYAVGIVLFAPDLVHFVLGRPVGAGGGAAPGTGDRRRDHAARLQLVLVLPRPRGHPAAGGRGASPARSPSWSLASPGLLLDGFRRLRARPDRRPRWSPLPSAGVSTSGGCSPTRASADRRRPRSPDRSWPPRRRWRCGRLWGGNRTLGQAIAELALFVAVYTAMALWRERPWWTSCSARCAAVAGGPAGPGPGSFPVGDDDVLETAALEARPAPVSEPSSESPRAPSRSAQPALLVGDRRSRGRPGSATSVVARRSAPRTRRAPAAARRTAARCTNSRPPGARTRAASAR